MSLEPSGRGVERLVPFDLAKFAAAARTDAQQRLGQPRRRIVLHDAGGAFGAQHAVVHRMPAIAFDVADAAVAQADFDAAAAGAHVAGGVLDLIGDRRALGDRRIVIGTPYRRHSLPDWFANRPAVYFFPRSSAK